MQKNTIREQISTGWSRRDFSDEFLSRVCFSASRREGIIIFCRARRQRVARATISKSLNYRRGRLLSEERHLIYTKKCCYKWERTVRSLKRFWSGVACVINKGETVDESDIGARAVLRSVIMMLPSLPLYPSIWFSWRMILFRDLVTTWTHCRRT